LHYIFSSGSQGHPQTRINKGFLLFAILQTVEDGFEWFTPSDFAKEKQGFPRRREGAEENSSHPVSSFQFASPATLSTFPSK
jgi:hypothetical protein